MFARRVSQLELAQLDKRGGAGFSLRREMGDLRLATELLADWERDRALTMRAMVGTVMGRQHLSQLAEAVSRVFRPAVCRARQLRPNLFDTLGTTAGGFD